MAFGDEVIVDGCGELTGFDVGSKHRRVNLNSLARWDYLPEPIFHLLIYNSPFLCILSDDN